MKHGIAYTLGKHWKLTATAAALGLGTLVLFATSPSKAPPVTSQTSTHTPSRVPTLVGLAEHDAMTLCELAIKKASKDPDSAKVPSVAPISSDKGEYFFSWGPSTKMMKLRNGLGNDVAATGSCVVSQSLKKVTQLTINGQSVM